MDYVQVSYGGIPKMRSLVASYDDCAVAGAEAEPALGKDYDSILVQMAHAVDPGEFYITHWSDLEEREQLFSDLNEVAPTFPNQEHVVPRKMYAVLLANNNWYRGIAVKICETYSVRMFFFYFPKSRFFPSCFLTLYVFFVLIGR